MAEFTTVQLNKTVVKALKKMKEHPRQTYNELILHLVKRSKTAGKHRTQYDDFLHKAQQLKMKELWDNSEDEAWKYA